MNQEDLKNVVNSFKECNWNYDNVNKIGTYKEDFNLQVKLNDKRCRKDDEIFIGDEWNDLFEKYPNSQLIDITFVYRDAQVDGITVLEFNKIMIPLPIAANMIDEFYENELSIARMFSDDKNSFTKTLSQIKQRKKNY